MGMGKRKEPMTFTELQGRLAERCALSEESAARVLQELAIVAAEEMLRTGVFVVPGIGRLENWKDLPAASSHSLTAAGHRPPARPRVRFQVAQPLGGLIFSECPNHGVYIGSPPCPYCEAKSSAALPWLYEDRREPTQ